MTDHVCVYSIDDCQCKICGKLFCSDHWCPINCPNPSERSEEDQLRIFEKECGDDS